MPNRAKRIIMVRKIQDELQYLESVLVLEAVGDQLLLAHLIEPVQLAAVESGEPVDASLQLGWQAEHAGLLERPASTGQHLNGEVDVERISRVAEMLLEIFI